MRSINLLFTFTHLHYITLPWWIIQYGVLFNSWCIGRSSETSTTWKLKQLLNSCWEMINQQLINGAINRWSKQRQLPVVHSHVDTLNIVSVNPVICACCKLLLSWNALKMLSVLYWSFWVVHLPGDKQSTFGSVVQTLPFLVFLNILVKHRDSATHGRKVTVH